MSNTYATAYKAVLTTILLGMLLLPTISRAGNIEAIKGKRYTITKKHGPWMIMVATIHDVPDESRVEGLSPEQAADELAYELRTRGIPAYVIKRDETQGNILTVNRLGKDEKRKYKLQEEYCVLAGNYDSCEDPVINKTLDYIKKLQPEFMMKDAFFRPRENYTGPLSHAFKTINPLLSQDEVAMMKRDPEIEYMNADMKELSLLKQNGKYSVVVATFSGKSIFTKNDKQKDTLIQKMDDPDAKKQSESLIDAMYMDAYTLAKMLREHDKNPQEAYVYHDHYKSVVTIGSFDTPNDPRIQQIKEKFSAKYTRDSSTGKMVYVGETFLLPSNSIRASTFSNYFSKFNFDKTAPRMVVFDPQPSVIQVTGTKLKQIDF